jgi:hypothetical protein
MIGLDTAKSVFQVHAVDDAGQVMARRKLLRSELFHSSKGKNLAWSPWRRAVRRITGRAC